MFDFRAISMPTMKDKGKGKKFSNTVLFHIIIKYFKEIKFHAKISILKLIQYHKNLWYYDFIQFLFSICHNDNNVY